MPQGQGGMQMTICHLYHTNIRVLYSQPQMRAIGGNLKPRKRADLGYTLNRVHEDSMSVIARVSIQIKNIIHPISTMGSQ